MNSLLKTFLVTALLSACATAAEPVAKDLASGAVEKNTIEKIDRKPVANPEVEKEPQYSEKDNAGQDSNNEQTQDAEKTLYPKFATENRVVIQEVPPPEKQASSDWTNAAEDGEDEDNEARALRERNVLAQESIAKTNIGILLSAIASLCIALCALWALYRTLEATRSATDEARKSTDEIRRSTVFEHTPYFEFTDIEIGRWNAGKDKLGIDVVFKLKNVGKSTVKELSFPGFDKVTAMGEDEIGGDLPFGEWEETTRVHDPDVHISPGDSARFYFKGAVAPHGGYVGEPRQPAHLSLHHKERQVSLEFIGSFEYQDVVSDWDRTISKRSCGFWIRDGITYSRRGDDLHALFDDKGHDMTVLHEWSLEGGISETKNIPAEDKEED